MALKVQWTHSICEDCWDKRNPDRLAIRVADGGVEVSRVASALGGPMLCCFCGKDHYSGIFVRADGRTLKCEGKVHDG